MIDIKRLAFDKSLSQRKMAEIMNTTQSEVSQMGNGNRRMMMKHIEALIDYFGEETINQYILPDEAFKPKTADATVTILTPEAVDEIKELGREEERQRMRSDVIEVDAIDIEKFSLPFATNDIVQSREIDIKKLVETNSPRLERFNIGKKLASPKGGPPRKYAQRIITEAMIGADFKPGDVICLSYLSGKEELISGYAYLVDTRLYGALFRKVTIQEDGLLLEPTNPKFESVKLRDEDIRSYACLIMQIRTSFSFEGNAHFAEMVKQRDEQIKELTESQSTLIEAQKQVLINQATLMAELQKQGERIDKEREQNRELVDKIINQ